MLATTSPLAHRCLILAVLAFTSAAAADGQRAPTPSAINAVIDRGVEALRGEVASDQGIGSPGESALVLYALTKGGAGVNDPAIDQLVSQLAFANLYGSYDRACAILALEALDPRGYRDWIHELAAGLVRDQNSKGGWGYPSGEDLSNIQFAAMGLWVAERANFEVPQPTWLDLADRLVDYKFGQGFGYRPGGRSTRTMTAAGGGVASILRSRPGLAKSNSKLGKRLGKYVEDSLRWIDKETDKRGASSLMGGWSYYYLYGLERLGALAGIKMIGDHDWYAEGAELLVRAQKEDGHWPGGTVQTCFAVLFLARATGPVTGGTRPKDRRTPVADSADSPMMLVAAGDTPLRLWIAKWNENRLAHCIWPADSGKGPRVLRVEYLAGQTVLAAVDGSSLVPAGASRFAAQHTFREPGEYKVHARAHIVMPRIDGKGQVQQGRTIVLESPAVAVTIDEAVPDWMRAQRAEQDFVYTKERPTVTASSHHSGGKRLPRRPFNGDLAIDGAMRTPWLAAESDPRPTLTLTFRRKVTLDGLRLYGARSTPYRGGAFRRPLEALVSIDGSDPLRVRMHVDERHAGTLDFPRPRRLREIEIVLASSAPANEYDLTGLAEVQLLHNTQGARRR